MDKFKNIIDSHGKSVRGIIKNITGAQNEDLEQEVYIKTWKNLDKYKNKGLFKQWINTIAANISRDFLRSKAFKQSTLNDGDGEKLVNLKDYKANQQEKLESEYRQKTIANAINSLKPKQKEVILLYEIEEFTIEEISKKINCPIGTVKSRLFNARKELSIILKELL